MYLSPFFDHRCNNASTFCGVALACASTEVLACTRICARVRAAVLVVESATRMALFLGGLFFWAAQKKFYFVSRNFFFELPAGAPKGGGHLLGLFGCWGGG